MAVEFRIEDVEAALLQVLDDAIAEANVAKIVSEDLDADGALIADLPAVRVHYDSTNDVPTRDNRGDRYATTHNFMLLCGARNLRSKAEQGTEAEKLVSHVRAALAGLVLDLPDGQTTEPVRLVGVQPFQLDNQGAWYALNVAVSSDVQYVRP